MYLCFHKLFPSEIPIKTSKNNVRRTIHESPIVTINLTTKKPGEHTCISKAPKVAHEASSVIVLTQNFKAAQSTNANPKTVEPFSSGPS